MDKLKELESRKNTKTRLTRSNKIFKTIIKAIQDKKGEDIISLDLKKIPEAVTDFFVICSATNTTQLKAIADFVEVEVKDKCGENPYKHEGRQGEQWILIDYVNIVVHIMMPDARKFYRIQEMWSDADRAEHND